MTTLEDLVWPATPCWSGRTSTDAVIAEMRGTHTDTEAAAFACATGVLLDPSTCTPAQLHAWRAYAAEVAHMNALAVRAAKM